MPDALGATRGPCPIKRCEGQMHVDATGALADGRPVEWTRCNRCSKTVETVGKLVAADHPTLFAGGS